jgi:hypothetical protein
LNGELARSLTIGAYSAWLIVLRTVQPTASFSPRGPRQPFSRGSPRCGPSSASAGGRRELHYDLQKGELVVR